MTKSQSSDDNDVDLDTNNDLIVKPRQSFSVTSDIMQNYWYKYESGEQESNAVKLCSGSIGFYLVSCLSNPYFKLFATY